MVRGVGADRDPSLCETSVVFVQPANPIRAISGREAVTMVVHTPSGLALNNPARFSAETRRFEAPVYWVEAGAHSVSVSLDGEALPGCPFLVEVRDPEDEDLGASAAAGETSTSGSKNASTRLKSSSTTTTTTTTVTTKNGVVVKDVRRSWW